MGMLILPLAIAGNIAPDPESRLELKTSLTISGVGVVVFLVGYLLQNTGRPS